jgi:hypothetical protein
MSKIKKILAPVFLNFKKPVFVESEESFCKMTIAEKNALKEARKIVKSYSTKLDNPFKSGYGSLDI